MCGLRNTCFRGINKTNTTVKFSISRRISGHFEHSAPFPSPEEGRHGAGPLPGDGVTGIHHPLHSNNGDLPGTKRDADGSFFKAWRDKTSRSYAPANFHRAPFRKKRRDINSVGKGELKSHPLLFLRAEVKFSKIQHALPDACQNRL